jgi:predicted DNA-binding transcriptional regulator YafY
MKKWSYLMPKIDNMLAVLWMLRSGEKVTAKQISKKLELNIRTVYRYIDTLSTSGVPIISDSGHNGGYSLLNHFKEAPLFFDIEEQTSLFHAAVFASDAGYYGGEALNRAVTKLGRHSNPEQETKRDQHLSSLEVISPIRSSFVVSTLKELETALADEYSIKITYKNNKEHQSSDRLIDPYRIIYWNRIWYVIGFCHLRKEVRNFRIDRIERLFQSQDKFVRPEDFSASNFFMKNLLPTLEDKDKSTTLIINGSTNALGEICQHWFLGHYLQSQSSNQATFLLEKDILHTYVPHMLLPYGRSIEVIEPISLKKRIIEVLSDLINFHQV